MGITFSNILKAILLCFVVGFLLTKLGLSPTDFWRGVVNLARYLITNAQSLLRWGLIYILAGAAVVVPVYLIILARRYFSGKR